MVFSSELENRFDVKYYDPKALEVLRRIKKKVASDSTYESHEFGEYGKMKKGIFSIPASEYKDIGIPFIRVSCIKSLTVDRNDLTYISDAWHKKESKTAVKHGDIAISKSGTIGCVALVPDWIEAANISQDIIGVYPYHKELSGFLAAYLSSKIGQIQMHRVETKQTHAHLTLIPLKKLRILYNKEIAEKISKLMEDGLKYEKEFMDGIDIAIKLLKSHIKIEVENKKYRTFLIANKDIESRFTPIFYYPPYLESNKRLNAAFQTIKLGNISKIINGKEVGSVNYKDDGVCFVRTSDLVNYGIDQNSYHKVSEEIYNKFKQDLQPEDILFTNDGKIGLSAMLIDGDVCVIQSHVKRVRIVDKKFTPEYIFIFLNTDFGLFQIYRRIFVQSTIPTIEDGLQDVDIPIIDEKIMEQITLTCKKAFRAKALRNTCVKESIALIESMFA